MSDPIPSLSLAASPGRFMLLREAVEPPVIPADPQQPRVRRYHLSRVGRRSARPPVNPGLRHPGDFSHLRRPHD